MDHARVSADYTTEWDSERSPLPEKRLGLALLSAIVPGAGQVVAGFRWRGAAMIAIGIVILAVALYYYQQGTSILLSYAVQPRILVGIFVVNIIVFLFRAAAIIDVFWATRHRYGEITVRWRQAVAGVVLVLLLAVTAAPHAVLGYYTYITHQMLTEVFSVEELSRDAEPGMVATNLDHRQVQGLSKISSPGETIESVINPERPHAGTHEPGTGSTLIQPPDWT